MTPFSSVCTPTYLYAEPQNSGWQRKSIVPLRSAARISAFAGRFAAVVSIGVLHHTPDTFKAFAGIAPRVAKGGRLVLFGEEFADGTYQERTDHGTDGPGGGDLTLNIRLEAGNVEVIR